MRLKIPDEAVTRLRFAEVDEWLVEPPGGVAIAGDAATAGDAAAADDVATADDVAS